MSFTGDGCIALFEERHFASQIETINAAVDAAHRIGELVFSKRHTRRYKDMTARIALHWGEAYIPPSGRLRDQIIGGDVVCATRVCDWLGRVVETATSPDLRNTLIGMTDAFHLLCYGSQEPTQEWTRHLEVELKGLASQTAIYWRWHVSSS